MSNQQLKVFASELTQDPVKGNNQRREIQEEEWLQGWGRLHGVTAQQLNQLFYLLTNHAAPSNICPFPYPDTLPVEDNMLHMNGQAISVTDTPTLFSTYGNNLPDMTADNLTGFIWVVRKH